MYRCSFAAEARGDPLFATAAPADGFLLIEHPGAWGRQALADSRLRPDVARALGARALAASLRVLLVKRHGRRARGGARRWALVDARPGREGSVWGSFAADAELLDLTLDLDGLATTSDPCYLVCTHGVHDACCALRGRPVAAELARIRAEAAWECSHVGGDRFAPNVLALPHGLYYGRVGVDDAEAVAEAHERGEVVPSLLRGRSAYRPPVQAAQHFARAELGERSIAALPPLEDVAGPDGTHAVRLETERGDVVVTVRQAHGETAGLLTCHATVPLHAPTFALVGIEAS